jgi:hypothetical protein
LGAASEAPEWVFWSSRESIDREVPSVTAIIESVIAVPLYWWVAIHFETYLLLLASVAIAPFVLLRSDQSVKVGVRWFMEWEKQWGFGELEPEARLVIGVIAVVGAFAAIFSSYLLARYFLIGIETSTAGAAAFGWTAMGAVAAATWVIIQMRLVALAVIAGALAAFVIGGGIGPQMTGAILAAIVVSAGIIAPALRTFLKAKTPSKLKLFMASPERLLQKIRPFIFLLTIIVPLLSILPMGFGIALGVFFISILVRVGATLKHIGLGLRALPRNFRRLIFCTSPSQQPELVPGLVVGQTSFTLPDHLREFREARSSDEKMWAAISYLVFPISTLLWFVPGWLYRLTLKSTAWFWWPLAFLAGELRLTKHPDLFRQKIIETLWAKASIAFALITIFGFIITTALVDRVPIWSNPFLTMLEFIFLVDWSVRLWQVVAVAAAILGVIIVFMVDSAARELRYATNKKELKLQNKAVHKFGRIERLARVRFLLVAMFWLLVGGHTVLYFNNLKCWFSTPPNVQVWAQWIYGDRMPPLQCSPNIHNTLLLFFTASAST